MSDIAEKLNLMADELATFSKKPTPEELGKMLVNTFDFFKELSPAIRYLDEAGLDDKSLYKMSRADVIDAFLNAALFANNP